MRSLGVLTLLAVAVVLTCFAILVTMTVLYLLD